MGSRLPLVIRHTLPCFPLQLLLVWNVFITLQLCVWHTRCDASAKCVGVWCVCPHRSASLFMCRPLAPAGVSCVYTGPDITGVTATYFNPPNGPDAAHPHLEFSVTPYSAIPAFLSLPWDPTVRHCWCSALHSLTCAAFVLPGYGTRSGRARTRLCAQAAFGHGSM